MRVVIAAVSSNRCISGVSRHAANLVKCLLTRTEVSALHVLVAPWEHDYVCEAIARKDTRLHVHSVALRPGSLHRNFWYLRALPEAATQLRADVVHIAYPSPIRKGKFSCPVVVTLHDLYPFDIPSNFSFPKVIFNRTILRQCLRNADAIACVSDSTRLSLGIKIPQVLPKVVTIFNCVESGPAPVKPAFIATWNSCPFLLCVAQHRRNKNVMLALRSFHRVITGNGVPENMRLLVVGMSGPESRRLHDFIRATKLSERVVFVSGIPDAEMSWCYRNCEMVVAPSLVEGFGLPVAEAQLAGCRVVCSDIPAFREIGGAGCRFIELTSSAEVQFADAIVAGLRARRPLPAYLPHLSPASIAEQFMTVYELLLGASRSLGIPPSSRKGVDRLPETHQSLRDEMPNAARF